MAMGATRVNVRALCMRPPKARRIVIAVYDRAPESDFRGYFSDTETKLDEGSTAISRHFEHSPLRYALETDWLVEAAGFEPLHFESDRPGHRLKLSLAMRWGTTAFN
jgi:hypothetical protein